jgi:6-phosphogluconolactonase/glucosamine-6-phosphate isomerase/deaminase
MNEDPNGHNRFPRMTLTLAGIARARLVLVTVAGEDKREALARVAAGDEALPATHIRAGHVLWIVDPTAAGDLA